MRQFPKAFGFAAVLLLTSTHAASAFSASFSWSGIRACGRTSPAFTIQDAPEGTERLRFMMNDKDAPNFRHGGSTIPYNGSGVSGACYRIRVQTGASLIAHFVVAITAAHGANAMIVRAANDMRT
jgi:phosphatidylethanolamine-binding protein (PEBP) family uncharacterized protein